MKTFEETPAYARASATTRRLMALQAQRTALLKVTDVCKAAWPPTMHATYAIQAAYAAPVASPRIIDFAEAACDEAVEAAFCLAYARLLRLIKKNKADEPQRFLNPALEERIARAARVVAGAEMRDPVPPLYRVLSNLLCVSPATHLEPDEEDIEEWATNDMSVEDLHTLLFVTHGGTT